MKEDVLFINKNHTITAEVILNKVLEERTDKYIIAISGESESGKSEISHYLGILLKKKGVKSKIINMDSFYLVSPDERRKWRQEKGIKSIGYNEYDWKTVDQVIGDYKSGSKSKMPFVDVISNQIDTLETDFKDIEILIINGLYSIKVKDAALKVFIEVTFEDTTEVQKQKEIEEIDDWRMKELKQEHKVIESLKGEANYFVDLGTSMKMYHL